MCRREQIATCRHFGLFFKKLTAIEKQRRSWTETVFSYLMRLVVLEPQNLQEVLPKMVSEYLWSQTESYSERNIWDTFWPSSWMDFSTRVVFVLQKRSLLRGTIVRGYLDFLLKIFGPLLNLFHIKFPTVKLFSLKSYLLLRNFGLEFSLSKLRTMFDLLGIVVFTTKPGSRCRLR